ncbi:MAG: enoyl-CoA hydratase/isomerase family protein [Syntrophales bacterium]|jgi:enoyl-CoA hydratase/carnithine racemase
MNQHGTNPAVVIMHRSEAVMSIILNRPDSLNSLNLEMIRVITGYLHKALEDDGCHLVLFYVLGDRGFYAGGDIKQIACDIQNNNMSDVYHFFLEEYKLDLMIFQFPKPVVVIANGIPMGGGLGISAGADWVIATENTRMAMPETKIWFFPDVGATGWLFNKCPPGYPEYLGLTSYEMTGSECVRLGLATHLAPSYTVPDLIGTIEALESKEGLKPKNFLFHLKEKVRNYFETSIPENSDMDRWVAEYFAGRSSLQAIIESLGSCRMMLAPCEGILSGLHEKSLTAMVLTLKLLRHNEHLPIDKVFEMDFRAIQFITKHPDFLEGIRARLIDKDNKPGWRPDRIDQVDLSELNTL